jgi:serine/threonine-protein kinase
VAALVIGVGAIYGSIWLHGRRSAVPNAIAVAPFDVFDVSLELWRNGLVDVLSRNFDGTGPLRAIPPSVVIARWKGRADSASARSFGEKVGAQLVVYGSLLPSGPDSARVRASLLDVARGSVVAEVEYREAVDRMDRVADSVSARLLRRLNESRSLGLPRMASLGSGNPAAIKAFLAAAQWSRTLHVDSTLTYSNRALEADSGFALAYLLRAYVRWSMTAGNLDSAAASDMFRAAALNRGLSRRDSLLIQTDSLFAALVLGRLPPSQAPRLFTLAQASARQYPNDPQIQYALGEAWYHLGYLYRSIESRAGAVNAFRRAVAADSSWTDAYYHLVLLFVDANDTAQLAATIDAVSRHTDSLDPEFVLVRQILREQRIDSAVADSFVRMRNTSTPGVVLKVLVDTGEVGLHLLRRRFESRRDIPMSPNDSVIANWHLARALFRRGHWREALGLPLTVGRHIVEPTVLGLAPDDTARMLLHRVVTRPPDRRVAMMLPWLARRRDTLAIDSILRDISTNPPTADKVRAIAQVRFFAAVAPGFRALSTGDSASAARLLDALPDSECISPACPYVYFERVRLARAQRRFAAAYSMSEFLPEFDIYGVGIAFILERAHAAEGLRRRAEAIAAYQTVLDAWKHADPEFRKYTDDATAGLRRLRGGSLQ